MDNVVDIFLHFLNQVRMFHWQTKSYARHQAYGMFYDSFGELIDDFIEAQMGKYGRVKTVKPIELQNLDEVEIDGFLNELEQFLLSFNKEYDQVEDSDLLNIRDETLGKLNKLRYLLTLD